MKNGFTIIELIFVIVILGILAMVAIPRLTATREDAFAANEAYNLSTAIEDFGAYYISQGNLTTPSQMTNVNFRADNNTNLSNDGDSISFLNCITITARTVNSTVVNALDIHYDASIASPRCQNVALAARAITNTTNRNIDSNKTFHFGGSMIVLN